MQTTMALLTKPKAGAHIFLYDGVCGLCNKFVQFILPKDNAGKFQFASLQSDFGSELLKRFGINSSDLNTFYLVTDYDLPTQKVLSKSDGALFVLHELGGVWSAVSLARFLPRLLRNWGYDLVAENRYKIFGKKDACQLPSPENKDRFIEV